MTDPAPQPAVQPPRPPFQFTLRTLLLLFVVLGSSLAVFGVWGIVGFRFDRKGWGSIFPNRLSPFFSN